MRARSLKPKLFKNELLGGVDPLITILFEGLWCCADREGRLEDRPLRLCAEVFPYRRKVTEKHVDTWLDWLDEHGFIVRYEVAGARFIQVIAFLKHQKPHSKEQASTIPALSEGLPLPRKWRAPTKAVASNGKGSGEHALTPDSGLLTPDSSLRVEAHKSDPDPEAHGTETGGDPDVAYELRIAIEAVYPAGTYGAQNWILAEREISKLLDAGELPADLLALTRAFRAQQDAKRSTGTQFVKSPETFFGEGFWRGPFPLPATKAQAQQDANVAASQEWLARSTHG